MLIKWDKQSVIKKFQEAIEGRPTTSLEPPVLPESPGIKKYLEIPKMEPAHSQKRKL
jgi:hypothetical protein